MKKSAISLLSLLLSASLWADPRVHVQRSDGGSGGSGVQSGGGVAPSGGAPSGGGSGGFHRESVGGGGGHGRVSVVRRSEVGVPSSHTGVVSNSGVVRSIESHRRVEVVPDHYYWHHSGGTRYVHYYHGGYHWYGFYDGPRFYWTRYSGGRWWWYDDGFDRWVFWHAGYWWWMPPGGVTYVYVNGSYEPYEDASIDADEPEGPDSAPSAPASTTSETRASGSWTSSDGRRLAQVFGPQSEAFLYDRTVSPPRYMAYLGGNVSKVRFSRERSARPAQILVDFKDGNFALFDMNGHPLDNPTPDDASSSSATPPPPAPPGD